MNAAELAAQVGAYDRLFLEARFEEAARVAEGLLWPLYRNGSEDSFMRLLSNTVTTTTSSTISLWMTLGDILYKRDAYDRARAFYLEALKLAPQESEDAAKLLYSIGNTQFLEGDQLQAREYYEKSLALATKLKLVACEAESLVQLSETARGLGDFDQAEQLARRSLEINLRDQRSQGTTRSVQSLCNIALYLDATGRRESAKEVLRLCLSSVIEQTDKQSLPFINQALAQLGLTDAHLNDKTD